MKAYIEAQGGTPMRVIADGLGISRPFLHQLADGTREPSFEVAQKIAKNTGNAVPITSWPKLGRIVAAGSPESPEPSEEITNARAAAGS